MATMLAAILMGSAMNATLNDQRQIGESFVATTNNWNAYGVRQSIIISSSYYDEKYGMMPVATALRSEFQKGAITAHVTAVIVT